MMDVNNSVVIQQTGQISLTTDLFSPEQSEIFNKVSVIADKNPILDWKKSENNHNLDFCLVKGKIEAVKNFHLKTSYISGLSFANTGVQVVGTGVDMAISCNVKVWKEGENRSVEMAGGSTIRECSSGGKNARAYHDAVARAQTRAFKNAVEAYMGFPFINLMIQSIFGAYEVTDSPEDEGVGSGNMKDVTEHNEQSSLDPETKKISDSIYKILKKAIQQSYLTKKEADDYWIRVERLFGRPDHLIIEQATIIRFIKEREGERKNG